MNIFDQLSIRHKLLLMVFLLLAPSVWLLYQTVSLQNHTIDLTRLELQGVDYARALEEVSGPIADHRGLADLYLNGDHTRAAALSAATAKVDVAIDALAKIESEVDARLQNTKQWREITGDWQAIKSEELTLPSQESERRHDALLEKLRALNTQVADESTLIFDPEATGYYLVDAAVLQIPRAETDIFDLRGALLSTSGLTSVPNAVRGDLATKADRVTRNADTLSASIDKLGLLLPDSQTTLKNAAAAYNDVAATFAGIIQDGLVLADKPQAIGDEAFTLGTKAYETAAKLHGVLIPLLQRTLNQRLSAATLTRNISLFGGGALLLIAMLLARVARLNIHAGAKDLVRSIERIANGEVGKQEHVHSSDEFGQVLTAVNRLDIKLVEVVAAMRATAETVGKATQELADGNEHLSGRTYQQAATIQQTASSMEEMTATVKQNADNAQQANRLVAGAHQQAERGEAVVHRAVEAMSEINNSSKRIADIIGVIDEIAFQTNLLALNAAVEAARAGEQGRGFAVVATEVRNLAQRSAGAAKEIKALINDSVDKVKDGAELVNESGKMLGEIMRSVKKATEVVADIAAASSEQSAGIEQVNLSVAQMDSFTQENSALVEQGKAVGNRINATANRLVNEIAFFKLHGQASSGVSGFVATAGSVATATANAASTGRVTASNKVSSTTSIANSASRKRPATAAPQASPPKGIRERVAAASGDGIVWKEF